MNYYHAGIAAKDDPTDSFWSDHTRRTRSAAEKEALAMWRKLPAANRALTDPIVEYWDRKHGLYPGNCDVVAGCDPVETEE